MKRNLLLLAAVILAGFNVNGQVFTESFNSTSFPSGWTNSNSTGSTAAYAFWRMTTSNPGYSASGFTDNTGTTGSYAMWVDGSTPYPITVHATTDSIDVSSLTNPSVEFYWFRNNYNPTSYPGGNKLYLDIFDGQTYTRVWTGDSDSAGFRKAIVDISCLTLNDSIALRFSVEKQNGTVSFYTDIIVDDIKVQELPSGYSNCAAPTALAFGPVSGGSVTASVTEGCNSSGVTSVIYGLAGFNPSSAGSSVTVSSGTATLSSLASSATYEAYAVTACSSTSYSDTLGPISFTTPCAIVSTPYSENFDATTTGSAFNPSLPVCWEFYTNSTSTVYYPYIYNRNYSLYAKSGTNFLYAYRSSSSSTSGNYADTTMAMTPQIQGLDSATKQISFSTRLPFGSYPGRVIIGLTDAAGTPGSLRLIDTVSNSSSVYTEHTVLLDGAISGDARVAFVFMREIGTADYVCIDDVSITDIPPCPEPLALTLNSATRTSATIGWTSSNTSFNIEVGPLGYSQGTGASSTSTTNSATVTGLSPNTYYDAYVQSNCSATGDGYSTWAGPFTFKTECASFAAPYTETFGYSDGSGSSVNPDLPDCWQVNNYSAYNQIVYVDKSSWSGNQLTDSAYLYLRAYFSQFATGTALGDTVLALLPMVDGLANNDKQLLINGKYASSSAAYNSEVIIATMDSVGTKSSLAFIDTITFGSTYADYTVDLDNVPANASRVALVVKSMLNSGYTYGYNWAYIDEVTVRDAPQCPEPANVVASVTSDSSAVIDWSDSATVSNYFVEWGQSGFTQGTGATIDTVSVSNWASTSLMAGTTYDVYIQSECASQGINSPWYGPITLVTPCEATSKPYIEGFENLAGTFGSATVPNLPDCWVQDRGVAASYMRGMSNTYGAYAGNGYVEFWGMAQNSDTVILSSPPLRTCLPKVHL